MAADTQLTKPLMAPPYTAHVDTFARDNMPPPEQLPEFLFTRPEFHYPPRINCVVPFLDRWVEQEGHGDASCMIGLNESYSYRELYELVNKISNVLVNKLGLVTGGRVLLRSANNPMMVATYLAIIKAGGVCVSTMPLLRAKELAYPLQKAKISLALCDGKLSDEMEKAKAVSPELKRVVYWGTGEAELDKMIAEASPEFKAVDTASDDICLIAFTSGTTGDPKGTMHFHRDMLAVCDGFARNVLRASPEDRFIGSAPLAFTFGFGGVLFPLHIGASFVVLEKAGPEELPLAVAKHKVTVCFTAPTAYRAILGKIDQFDLSTLRKCVSAGETLPKGTYDAWLKATGIKLMDGIGGTEMLHIFICAIEEEIRPGSTGKPVPGYIAKIIDDEGNDVPPGTLGRLAVKGPTGCKYLADPRQLKFVQNGWNITGDTFLMDEDGYYWYQSRSDDMIVSSGYNIAGTDVEGALLTHEAVVDCGVVGCPDADRGMIVKAYVVLAPGQAASDTLAVELQNHVKREIAPYKYPRAIEFVTQLPKTETGKLKRFALRQQAAVGTSPTVAA